MVRNWYTGISICYCVMEGLSMDQDTIKLFLIQLTRIADAVEHISVNLEIMNQEGLVVLQAGGEINEN